MFYIFAGHHKHRENTQLSNIHGLLLAGVATKWKEFSSVLIPSKKKNTNQHRNLNLDPQPAGFMAK